MAEFWHRPQAARSIHFFKEGKSLCGHYTAYEPAAVELKLSAEYPERHDYYPCQTCERRFWASRKRATNMDRINAADVVKAIDHLAQLRALEAQLRAAKDYGPLLYQTTTEITTSLKTLENILVRVA